jgi:hypothetical protein
MQNKSNSSGEYLWQVIDLLDAELLNSAMSGWGPASIVHVANH